ncbi:TetR/AcrR family transcriptional regulator [Actinokineospora sp. UTMC 2448]|uniref:TetR/AcrR family transcriptional regulator n=1 Tax=Actinokineospora sp. UTMC 2448 TaxID=2268449 RepID=UPI0021640AC0|nr:TetR/AcrR family transcriptional regulator [Actinokineospora sp. UTMC 2448]UVS80052.1 transcriptional regulator BetI [Actinokineospora sp. UTMC 2448]
MPKQVDPAARRAAIGDAVVDIAAEHGFAAVTIRAVARRAGASTSVVTHYVAGRDDLLRQAVRREVDARREHAERVLAGRTGADGLRTLADWAVHAPGERAQRFWLALVMAAPAEPVLRAELDRFTTWWDARVRALVAEAGLADPGLAADLLDVAVDGLITARFEGTAAWSARRSRRVLAAVLAAAGLSR